MDLRKEKEIKYYDLQAEKQLKEISGKGLIGDFEGFDPAVLSSVKFCYQWLENNCQNKQVLDYGCGNGVHSVFLAKTGAQKVVGIDLSENSLLIARERLKRADLSGKVDFLKMDCEKMEFSDNSFDIIFDGGTFSSIDLKLALPELARILKPNGFLIGIETFGHNPFTNLKREINKITGKRTEWAASHILLMKDLDFAENYFNKIEVYYFHLISWLVFSLYQFGRREISINNFGIFRQTFFGITLFEKIRLQSSFCFFSTKNHTINHMINHVICVLGPTQ